MFITNEIELDAAADQLEAFLLIEDPSDEQKIQHSMLAKHMEQYIASLPTEQDTMH